MNFEEAVLPHLDAAYNLARWLTRNDTDAQDVVQEAYLRALRFFSGFHGSDARAWLLTIVRNTCFTWLRRNRSPELSGDFDEIVNARESETPNPETAHVLKVQAQLVNEAIEKLPIEFREVMVLRELEELSYKEIAAVTGIPIGTVMSRLARARKRLLALLREEKSEKSLLDTVSTSRESTTLASSQSGITKWSNEYVKAKGESEIPKESKRRVMKKQVAMIGLLVVMTMVAAGTSANAQLHYKMTANIPFEFTVANKKLPAGEYSVTRAQQTAGDLILQISSKDGRESIARLTIPVNTLEPKDDARLIFHRYGDEYFLFEIWPAGGSTGRELPKSRAERDAEQKFRDSVVGMAAVKAPQAEIVTIVADLR